MYLVAVWRQLIIVTALQCLDSRLSMYCTAEVSPVPVLNWCSQAYLSSWSCRLLAVFLLWSRSFEETACCDPVNLSGVCRECIIVTRSGGGGGALWGLHLRSGTWKISGDHIKPWFLVYVDTWSRHQGFSVHGMESPWFEPGFQVDPGEKGRPEFFKQEDSHNGIVVPHFSGFVDYSHTHNTDGTI